MLHHPCHRVYIYIYIYAHCVSLFIYFSLLGKKKKNLIGPYFLIISKTIYKPNVIDPKYETIVQH